MALGGRSGKGPSTWESPPGLMPGLCAVSGLHVSGCRLGAWSLGRDSCLDAFLAPWWHMRDRLRRGGAWWKPVPLPPSYTRGGVRGRWVLRTRCSWIPCKITGWGAQGSVRWTFHPPSVLESTRSFWSLTVGLFQSSVVMSILRMRSLVSVGRPQGPPYLPAGLQAGSRQLVGFHQDWTPRPASLWPSLTYETLLQL